MAVDVTLNNVGNGYNRSAINDNFTAIDTALQDALSRSGTGPNQMNADIDMNSNDLLNVATLDVDVLTVDGVAINTVLTAAVTAAQLAETNAETAEANAEAAQAAAQASAAAALVSEGNAEDSAEDAAASAQIALAASEVYALTLTPQMFGAVPDVSTSLAKGLNRDAFRAAMVQLKANGGGKLFIPPGVYHLDLTDPIYVPSNVTIEGVRGASVVKPDITTLPAAAVTGVFVTGDPDTDTRAGVGTSTNNVGIIDPASVVSNIHFKDFSIISDYAGPTLSGNTIRGIHYCFVYDGSIRGMEVVNMPNTGISMLGGARIIITENVVLENGQWGEAVTTRNGISASGFMDTVTVEQSSHTCVVSNNIANDNLDEGIQFALIRGITVTGNTCKGNGDRGIEGDSGYAQTITDATHSQEVPADCVITGNYVDGFGQFNTDSAQGITVVDSNQGRAIIANNIVRNIDNGYAIAFTRNNNGYVTIENNVIEDVTLIANRHVIYAQCESADIFNNKLLNVTGTDTTNTGITVVYTKTARIHGNQIDGNTYTGISATCALVTGTYTPELLSIDGNYIDGTVADAITSRMPWNTTLDFLSVRNNVARAINSSAATDKAWMRTVGSASNTSVITRMVVEGNQVLSLAGATRYPITHQNFSANEIVEAVVRYNHFGAGFAYTFGTRVHGDESVCASLYQDQNVLASTGPKVTRGSSAPSTGTWANGDICWKTNPANGTHIGFVCVTAGTPGTWRPFGAVQGSNTWTVTNSVTDRSYDANATTTDELADVLGTLITDLKTAGVLL